MIRRNVELEKGFCSSCRKLIGRFDGGDWMHEDGTVLCNGWRIHAERKAAK
jgi:hypothetical protein